MTSVDPERWYRHALANRLQSLLLLASMAGFMALLGWLLWGAEGVIWLLFAGAMLMLVNPAFSSRLILRMFGASPLTPQQVPWLHTVVRELSRRGGLSTAPRLYYVPSSMINAFATGGREHAAIALTDGLLRNLSEREAIGILAHELSHVINDDTWVMGIADLFSRLTSALSLVGQMLVLLNLPMWMFSAVSINWFAVLLLVFAPTLSALTQLALSRTREYDADLNAVRLTGDPQGLASALAKIEQLQDYFLERIFLPDRGNPEPSLLRTHPPAKERIRRLMALQSQPARSSVLFPGEATGIEVGSEFHDEVRRAPSWHLTGLWH